MRKWLQEWLEDYKHSVDANFANVSRSFNKLEVDLVSVLKAVRDSSDVDIMPLMRAVKEAKAETEEMGYKMDKVSTAVHTALSWEMPCRLAEIRSDLHGNG